MLHIASMGQPRGNSLSLDPERVPLGMGSGFVWDKEGHCVTNYHVIHGASQAQVDGCRGRGEGGGESGECMGRGCAWGQAQVGGCMRA